MTVIIPEWFLWLVVIWLVMHCWDLTLRIWTKIKVFKKAEELARLVIVDRVKENTPPGVYEIRWKALYKEENNA